MTSLYLSRLAPNSRHRGVQRDLADCYAMHQRILSGFPNGALHEHAREQFGVLFRVDQGRDGPVMLVQSRALPDWTRLPTTYLAEPAMLKQIDSTYDALETGMMQCSACALTLSSISARNLRRASAGEASAWSCQRRISLSGRVARAMRQVFGSSLCRRFRVE